MSLTTKERKQDRRIGLVVPLYFAYHYKYCQIPRERDPFLRGRFPCDCRYHFSIFGMIPIAIQG